MMKWVTRRLREYTGGPRFSTAQTTLGYNPDPGYIACPHCNGIRVIDDIPGLRRILRGHKVIAVVGLSADWFRPSYFAAKYMQQHGYRIIPVNPRYSGQGDNTILGQRCYASLRDIPEPVDMVDVFRRSEDVLPIAQEAVAIGAKVLWQQLGVHSPKAVQVAEAAGLACVVDRCVKIEHARLFGGLGWVGVNTRVISAKRPL